MSILNSLTDRGRFSAVDPVTSGDHLVDVLIVVGLIVLVCSVVALFLFLPRGDRDR